jgi:hypothetical protein
MNCFYCHDSINPNNESHVIYIQNKSCKATHYECTESKIEQYYVNYMWWKQWWNNQ